MKVYLLLASIGQPLEISMLMLRAGHYPQSTKCDAPAPPVGQKVRLTRRYFGETRPLSAPKTICPNHMFRLYKINKPQMFCFQNLPDSFRATSPLSDSMGPGSGCSSLAKSAEDRPEILQLMASSKPSALHRLKLSAGRALTSGCQHSPRYHWLNVDALCWFIMVVYDGFHDGY